MVRSDVATMASPPAELPVVAHVIHRFQMGGLENGLVNLINRTPPGRYRHALVCLTESTSFSGRLVDASVPVYSLHKREGKDLACYVRLWQRLRDLRPAIVHTRNYAAVDCVAIAALAGVRHRVHGEHGWDMHDVAGTNRRYRTLRRLFRPFVSRYVSVSRDLDRWLGDWVGIPGHRRTVICNGVDTVRFTPPAGRAPLPVEGFASGGDVVIGTVGRQERVKDPVNLAKAFVHLVRGNDDLGPRLRLVMLGDGAERPAVEAVLRDGGVTRQCWLPGPRDDVADLLKGLDVFVLPSRNEGISNTILEAMATGLPVLATAVGGNLELVADDETGTLVPPADFAALGAALERYARDAELRRSHGAAGRHHAENRFSLDAMVASYMALYDDLLGREALPAMEAH